MKTHEHKISLKSKIISLILLILFYFLFVYGAGKMLSHAISYLLKNNINLPLPLNGVVYYPLVGIVVLLLYKFIARIKFSELGIQKIKKGDWQYTLYIFAALFVIAVVSRIIDPGFDSWYAGMSNLSAFATFIALMIVMPFQVLHEEIFQRSLLQSTCSRAMGSFYTAIIISASFAIAHFFWIPGSTYHIIINVVFVFLGSLLLVALFEKTRNLLLSFLVHLVYNFVVLFQIFFHINRQYYWEILLFIAWGLIFFFTARKLHRMLKDVFFKHKIAAPDAVAGVFIAVAGVIFPILMYYLMHLRILR